MTKKIFPFMTNKHSLGYTASQEIDLVMWNQNLWLHNTQVQQDFVQDLRSLSGEEGIAWGWQAFFHLVWKWTDHTTNSRPHISAPHSVNSPCKIRGEIFELLGGLFCGSGTRGREIWRVFWGKQVIFPFLPQSLEPEVLFQWNKVIWNAHDTIWSWLE